ncbi:folate-binding protein YgfZ [Kocuria sp. cx-455]|uniref:CAF17-like 4Fe-4S cluster assembly/insertion protein YgfZ n=1 Tax=Kocuria sp. cx-455 TaxID=2771377 RepID=UPI001683E81D|nr:folate-binding protein YgfZ [Kocuria sp. cx-455]MBD2764285.1 folate-binding protein YgfZ [Kocuria sp. cx-455]
MTSADSSYRSVLLSRPGAVAADNLDEGVAGHYGDPVPEQRALDRGTGYVDQSQRGVVTVTGADRLSWLTTLSSQVLTGLQPGQSTETMFLSIQGRVEFAPHAVDDGTTTWLIAEAQEAPGLAAWLESMRFAMRVEVADVSSQWAVIAATKDLSAQLTAALEGPRAASEAVVVWRDPWPEISPGGYAYSAAPDHPGFERPWFEHLVPMNALETAAAALEEQGCTPAGSWAAEALRIAAWRPRWGAETDAKTIPHELDWMRTAVHLSKGCYKGQETVARVHNLGHPPRRLTFLDLDGSQHTLPAAGADVVLNDKVVGRVTSARLHHEAGPIALAVLKRNVDPQADLLVRDTVEEHPEQEGTRGSDVAEQWSAAQTVVVQPDAGSVVGRPKNLMRGPRDGGMRL